MVHSFITFHLCGEPLDEEETNSLREVSDGRHRADGYIDAYISRHGLESEYSGDESNLFGIRDDSFLMHTVHYFSSLRAAEILGRKAIPPFGFGELGDIHGELFGDIYPFAGVLRTSDYGFSCKPSLINMQGEAVFSSIQANRYLRERTHLLPKYLGDLSVLRPFEHGNHMAIHLLFEQMGRFAGWRIDWSRLDWQKVASFEQMAAMGKESGFAEYLMLGR